MNQRLDETNVPLIVGGEIQEALEKLWNKQFECWCGNTITLNEFQGYPHDGGLSDGEGTKLWVYATCKKCNYQWAVWKLLKNVQKRMK